MNDFVGSSTCDQVPLDPMAPEVALSPLVGMPMEYHQQSIPEHLDFPSSNSYDDFYSMSYSPVSRFQNDPLYETGVSIRDDSLSSSCFCPMQADSYIDPVYSPFVENDILSDFVPKAMPFPLPETLPSGISPVVPDMPFEPMYEDYSYLPLMDDIPMELKDTDDVLSPNSLSDRLCIPTPECEDLCYPTDQEG